MTAENPRVRSPLGVVALLLLHLAAVAWLTLRPSRTLFSCQQGALTTRDPDGNLFLVHDTARWDGSGQLSLRTTARTQVAAAGVGLVPVLFGGKGEEQAVVVGWRRDGAGPFVCWHESGAPPPATPADPTAALPEDAWVTLHATVWRDQDVLRVRTQVDGAAAVEATVPATRIHWPVAVGLWTSGPGPRAFRALRAARDGVPLVDATFARPELLAGFTAVVDDLPPPFTLGHVPFFRRSRYGLWNTLRQDGLDVFNNLLLFAPTGALLALLLRRRPVAAAALTTLLLSLAIEVLQLSVPTRVSSVYDVLCNTLGATLAAWGMARVRTLLG